ncbi:MAG TPA: hypothetical protein VLF18_18530 [Tahibacter sp.]|uniref:hypothetical protein n=1 Tax=Tahibacter sp. TaxID=2056211 RepID=UPI002B5A00E9|nr:hypothetical protein [Tahibacter sp.]HSX62184.1 hypothetical protein [Tahibacter sp.]
MKTHWEFFKEGDHSFGMFYPRHYILAGFDSFAQAQSAESELLRQGFTAEEVRSATGEFVVNELESMDDASFLDRLKMQISKAVGTEAGYIDDDLELARSGGAFLFVYAPTDDDCRRAMATLGQLHPVFARRYLPMAIERLIYPARVQPDV